MSFKQRVGNFLLLLGVIGLLVFVASVLVAGGNYDVTAFLVGAVLFGLGLNFRLSKPSGPPREAPMPAAQSAKGGAKAGPPKAGQPGGGPPKSQGLVSTLLKGPPPKPGGGGPPPKKK
jgi:hypothetical protein